MAFRLVGHSLVALLDLVSSSHLAKVPTMSLPKLFLTARKTTLDLVSKRKLHLLSNPLRRILGLMGTPTSTMVKKTTTWRMVTLTRTVSPPCLPPA